MRIITDWHLHSRFSRACSQDLTLENNALWCEKKGVNVLGTADFTHPVWFSEMEEKLAEEEPGLYRLKSGAHPTMRYMMTSEVAQIYKRGGKARRIHNILVAPSLEAVRKVNAWLDDGGYNRKADGRPILGLDSEELYKRLRDIDERIIMIPAHAWTPWFSVFGSKSGFDSLEECFGSMTPYIYAIETGLSSDPLMNRSLSALDNVTLISNSDAHSPRNFGREANVFEIDPAKYSYDEFVRILRERDASAFKYTIEFFPEEGKYHIDGCAACGFSCEPTVTKAIGGVCPTCRRPLTIGVMSRVADLANRVAAIPPGHVPFKSIVPLQEILAECSSVSSTASKKVQELYENMIIALGNEFTILLDASRSDIAHVAGDMVAEAIERVRIGNVSIIPGYDGIYGKVSIFKENDQKMPKQETLL
ncbi:MAG: endonuclease Q family protein [Patescibacteria group bacterium]